MYIVVDTDKGGGRLVPIGGVIHEHWADAVESYKKAVAKIYNGDDSYGAVIIFQCSQVFSGEYVKADA